VLGAIPLALASGAGAESRQQIGWVIVGGMSVGTLLTIFVVPTMYTLLSRDKSHSKAKAAQHDGGHADAAIPAK
jgi:multidrug efflux pump